MDEERKPRKAQAGTGAKAAGTTPASKRATPTKATRAKAKTPRDPAPKPQDPAPKPQDPATDEPATTGSEGQATAQGPAAQSPAVPDRADTATEGSAPAKATPQPVRKHPEGTRTTRAKRAGSPGAAPTRRTQATPATPETPPSPVALWERIRSSPGYLPELLAEEVVRAHGPAAATWARRVRETYPQATPDALARLAVAEHTRYAWGGGILAALSGWLAPLVSGGAGAIVQGRLVLHIAAAYDVDPTDPARVVDVLVLTRVHPDPGSALAAVRASGEPTEHAGFLVDAAWRIGAPLARLAGIWSTRRTIGRLVPGAAAVLGAVGDADALDVVATRAVQHYRPPRRR